MSEIVKRRVTQSIVILGPLVTILINPWGNYDPINPIKLLALTTISFFSFGLVISEYKIITNLLPKSFVYFNLFFVIWLWVSFIFSGAPKSQQFWGIFGRNTGLVLYLSLALLTIASSLIQDKRSYSKLLNAFLYVGLFETIYCYLQIAKLDPIKWSIFDIFGTLGNANFLSAFLGMTSVATLALLLSSQRSLTIRILLLFFLFAQLYILRTTSSIQGLMLFFGSSLVVLYLFIHYKLKWKFLRIPYMVLSSSLLGLSFLAFFNTGPLSKLIYQETLVFRMDYWHAGLRMTLMKPIFGVGLDSYGDWYRQVRGFISATRTDPNRTANTAHNIFLDISSGGGLPLLAAYLILLSVVMIRSFQYLRLIHFYDPVFIAIFSAWIGYQLQSLISINQVGVGVWGWLFSGVLIGYSNLKLPVDKKKLTENNNLKELKKTRPRKKHKVQKLLTPGKALIGFTLMLLGFLISIPPMTADIKFRSAMNKGDLNGMISASQSYGATAWHLTQVIEAASKANYTQQAIQMDLELIRRFPRDFYGWRVAASLNGIPAEIQAKARKKILELDPDNPNLNQFRS